MSNNPSVKFTSNPDDDILKFTLSGVNVSLANAIRRTILSDIPTIVFRTSPNNLNKCNIISNTSRFNNDIIKHRLSCIPIFISDIDNEKGEFDYKNFIIEINVENTTENIIYVTTENFVIKDKTNGNIFSKDKTREIFPPDEYTGCFIDFIRLQPKLTEELLGEKLNLTCEFDIGDANENSAYNVVSTCSYGNTIDSDKQNDTINKLIVDLKAENKSQEDINFEIENWKLLEGKRIFIKDSFDFIIETIGINTNNELVNKACNILIKKLDNLNTLSETNELEIINNNDSTISNCYDIILKNEDYTIGCVVEYYFYSMFFENTKQLTFCGFKKKHPHDNYSIVRVAYKNLVDLNNVKTNLKECLEEAMITLNQIKKHFVLK